LSKYAIIVILCWTHPYNRLLEEGNTLKYLLIDGAVQLEVKSRITKSCKVRILAHFGSPALAKAVLKSLKMRDYVVKDTFDYDLNRCMLTCQIYPRLLRGMSVSQKLAIAEFDLMDIAKLAAERYLELHPEVLVAPIIPLSANRPQSKDRGPKYQNQGREFQKQRRNTTHLHTVRR
jgi:hypothetical protein